MPGQVLLSGEGPIAFVRLSHAGRLNAMSRAMWQQLRALFETIQSGGPWRCVVVQGEACNFCAGGDISEYPDFRFSEAQLRDFHENDVWGGLGAMLACDVPVVACIEGACMGAGLEIASCCDIRIGAESAVFGAPIAKLGFPMAPREAQLLVRAAGEATAREMLLEAAVLPASEMKSRGFLSRVVPDADARAQALAAAQRVAALSPQAARLNKQALRALAPQPLPSAATEHAAQALAGAYRYADSAEHREGITAFLDKRKPLFQGPEE